MSWSARDSFTPQYQTLGIVITTWVLYVILTATIEPIFQSVTVWFFMVLFAGCWSNIYWFAFCVTESGRRQYIANILAAEGPLSIQDIMRIYDQKYIYENRIQRLIDLGEIIEKNGKLYPRQSLMHYVTLVFFVWSRILGYRWMVK
jgi:hypothetical protein